MHFPEVWHNWTDVIWTVLNEPIPNWSIHTHKYIDGVICVSPVRPLIHINKFPLLVSLNGNKNRACNPTFIVWNHLRLHLRFNNPKRREPITLPKPLVVPNIPNFESFIFKDNLISLVADESKPLEIFIAPSALSIIQKRKIR